MKGDPRCPECDGRGGTYRHGRFVVCDCVRMTPARRAAQRQQSTDDLAAFRRVQEAIRRREQGQ